jgi:hypothetical protein
VSDWTLSQQLAEQAADLEQQVAELAASLRTACAQLEIERQAVEALKAMLAGGGRLPLELDR